MEPSSKKRSGLFGAIPNITNSLFGRSTVAPPQGEKPAPAESDKSTGYYNKGTVPPGQHGGYKNASPESPAKRASDAQLSTRKIIGRPQGPSSRFSQSTNAADFGASSSTAKKTNFSSLSNNTPKAKPPTRMPGDNPHKFNSISSSIFSTSTRPAVNFSGSATMPRNLFRGSSMNGRPEVNFSPRRPYNTLKESFPPTTPGRAPRGSTAELNGRALVHTSSTELFDQRIPSPPRDLTGERLGKEVPEDQHRGRSIYADEFLSHYCPEDFDEVQRAQFFAILDLRRLKSAADDVFATKDWKVNILNFAKEYEKSRSLILLRYGLYEFKTVKPSEALKKQWFKENGIPTSDDESGVVPYKANGGQSTLGRGKRKAEEELPPKDTLFAASASNLNKRRVTEREPAMEATTPATSKAKRKADVVGPPDENPPKKLQKAATPSSQKPSATKSIFERIANGTSNESTSPAPSPAPSAPLKSKSAPPPSIFSSSKPTNGDFGRSVLDVPSPAPSSNIFGHLSDASKGSPDGDADGESEDETASDADGEAESDPQDVSQSDEPSVVASGGVGTPQFGAGAGLYSKKAAVETVSNTSSEAGENTSKGRSLFDRMTYGNDGQPVRVLQGEKSPQPSPPETEKAATSDRDPTPTNKTWNTDTPIKFAPAPSQPGALFGSAAPKSTGSLFAPKEAPKPAAASSAPAITLEPPTPSKVAPKPASPAKEAPKPAAMTPLSLFGVGPGTALDTSSSSILSNAEFSAPSASSIFAAKPAASSTPVVGGWKPTGAAALFGQTKPAEEKATGTIQAPAPSTALFGIKPTAPAADVPRPASAQLFGTKPSISESEASKPASTPMFGAKPTTTESKPAASPFFGAKPAPSETKTSEPAAPVFGSTNMFGNVAKKAEKPKSTTSQPSGLFGMPAKAPEGTATTTGGPVGFSFGQTAAPFTSAATSTTAPAKPLFGSTIGQSSGPFGGLKDVKPMETEPKPAFSFGGTPTTSGTSTPKPMFGTAPLTQAEPAKPQSIFANPSFGATTSAPAESPFKFGTSQSTAPAPMFGSQVSQTQQNTQSTAPLFGGSASSSFTFAPTGGEQSSFNNPFATNGASSAPPSFNFGPNTGADNTASQSSSTPFAFAGSSAQPPSLSFGAGSGATTPTPSQPGSTMFGNAANGAGAGAGASFGSSFTFGGTQPQSQPSNNIFAPQPNAAGGSSIFASGLAPGGTSTGTNSPFTFGGASSLATTPATGGTPEPGASAGTEQEQDANASHQRTQADGDDAPQEQISLTEGGPGEEDEAVVHEVRVRAMKLETSAGKDTDDDGSSGDSNAGKKSKNPWMTKGVGPLRLLKHNNTGAVRMLLRAEPRGHIALNKMVLPEFTYKTEPAGKYVKVTTADDTGKGLETWMLQMKTKELGQALVDALEANKMANKKT